MPQVSQAAFAKLQKAAEEHGKPIYEALVQEHRTRIAREREKADYAFAARRKTDRADRSAPGPQLPSEPPRPGGAELPGAA